MRPEYEIVQLVLAYQDVWYSYFPMLSRRAEWHTVNHLCLKGRSGSSVGELYGLVKQIFLLDDATVKERLLTISQMGLCELDPGPPIHARTVLTPTDRLLVQFDAHLRAFAPKLSDTAAALGWAVPAPPPAVLSPQHRALLLQPLEIYAQEAGSALDQVFELRRLSPQRRLDAKRHLISSSHWNLLHRAMQCHYLADETGTVRSGILADRLAAQILQLTGQTLQTTRDHIAYLLEIGLLQRMKGKALHVSVSNEAMPPLHQALGRTAERMAAALLAPGGGWGLATAARPPAAADSAADSTVTIHRSRIGGAGAAERRFLEIAGPAGDIHRVALHPPLTIGRMAPSEIVLNSGDISRMHCRVTEDGADLVLTDLHSTNGTFVNDRKIDAPTVLKSGDLVRVGSYVLACREEADAAAPPAAETTQHGRVVPLMPRRQSASR